MELHVTIEAITALVGILIFISTYKAIQIENQIISWIGIYVVLTGVIHIITDLCFGNGPIGDFIIPMSWIAPAVVVPFWIKMILDRRTIISPLNVTAMVMLVMSMLSFFLFMQSYYWYDNIIKRPLEFIPILLGIAILSRVWVINTKGKVLSSILILYISSHAIMLFSTKMYDEIFFISHAFKLAYTSAFFLAINHFNKEREHVDNLDEIKKILDELLKK